jgi:hypothetical protein
LGGGEAAAEGVKPTKTTVEQREEKRYRNDGDGSSGGGGGAVSFERNHSTSGVMRREAESDRDRARGCYSS